MTSRVSVWFSVITLCALCHAKAQGDPKESLSRSLADCQRVAESVRLGTSDESDLAKSIESVSNVFVSLPEDVQKGYAFTLTALWIEIAPIAVDKRFFRSALHILNEYGMVRFKFGEEHSKFGVRLFRDKRVRLPHLLLAEAATLSALGRTENMRYLDHWLLRIPGKSAEEDLFVAAEETEDDEEQSITIPPLPANSRRVIVYLLSKQSGTFEVTQTVQFVTSDDLAINIWADSGSSVVYLSGVDRIVDVKNNDGNPVGIPTAYRKLSTNKASVEIQNHSMRVLP